MKGGILLAWLTILATTSSLIAYAADPNPLQDFCVATTDPNNTVYVNGFVCKNPNEVTSEDFLYKGLNIAGTPNNFIGTSLQVVSPKNLPGLNTLGLSLIRIDYAVSGVGEPHVHPHATEVVILLEGSLYVGFVSSSNKLFSKILSPGDVFVLPQGLVHFSLNLGTTNVVSYAAFSSQNPGIVSVGKSVFGAQPSIPVDLLAKAFQLDPKIAEDLQTKFSIILNN